MRGVRARRNGNRAAPETGARPCSPRWSLRPRWARRSAVRCVPPRP